VSWVPQRPQKERVTAALERSSVGAPLVNRSLSNGTLNHASAGAPDTRLQSSQWHSVQCIGGPSAS
jgi:hypothetical protein